MLSDVDCGVLGGCVVFVELEEAPSAQLLLLVAASAQVRLKEEELS